MKLTSNYLFSATERQLLTLSLAEIIDGLLADYKSFSQGNAPGIRIPKDKLEPRMGHSCILYAEGLRLAHTHLELAKKLITTSLFYFSDQATYWFAMEKKIKEEMKKKNEQRDIDILDIITASYHPATRAVAWLKANGEADLLRDMLKTIKDFEDFKAKMREAE